MVHEISLVTLGPSPQKTWIVNNVYRECVMARAIQDTYCVAPITRGKAIAEQNW